MQHNSLNTRFEFACNGNDRRYVWSKTRPEQGRWYHLVGVYNGTHAKIYVNGIEDTYGGPKELSGDIPVSASPVALGRSATYGDRHIYASIDEVAIWSRSLSADEIYELYKKGGIEPNDDEDNCVYLNSLNETDLGDIYYESRNSSYSKWSLGIENHTLGGINTTDHFYLYYMSDKADGSDNYKVRYANGSSGTNVSFADSKVAWTSSSSFEQAPFTPDLWFATIKEGGDQFQLGVYVENSTGANYTNFSFYTDDIGDVNHPITSPSIHHYHRTYCVHPECVDVPLDGALSGTMYVDVGIAIDPDNVGAVAHNLSLYTNESVYVTTINASFYSLDDSGVHIAFNTTTVPDGEYKMKVTATADDNPNNVQSYITPENFTIDNTKPQISIITTNNTVWSSVPTINGTAFDINADEIYANDSDWIWNGNYTIWNFTNNEGIVDGTYNILITALDLAGNSNSSSFVFTLSSEPGTPVPVLSSIWYKVLLLVIMSGLLWFKRRSPPR